MERQAGGHAHHTRTQPHPQPMGVMPDLSKMATVRLTFLKGHSGCMSVERLKGQQQKQKNNSGSLAVLASQDKRNGTVSAPGWCRVRLTGCPEPNTLTVGLSEQHAQAVLLLNITASFESFKYHPLPFSTQPCPGEAGPCCLSTTTPQAENYNLLLTFQRKCLQLWRDVQEPGNGDPLTAAGEGWKGVTLFTLVSCLGFSVLFYHL